MSESDDPPALPPPGIIDAHLHVIDPGRFAYHDGPGYRPLAHERGPREQLGRTLDAHGVRHGLLVQPSCYGDDNRAMLEAIAAAPGRFRGIAVVRVGATGNELESLKNGGVIGIRWNLEFEPLVLAHPGLDRLLARVRELDWCVEVHAAGDLLVEALSVLRAARIRALVDHWGRPVPAAGPAQPAFQDLLRCGRDGTAVVKLSAPYRVSSLPPPHGDLDPFAEALLAAFSPRRCVWGSDWPFINTRNPPTYSDALAAVGRWAGGGDLHDVLWTAPARLCGFE